MAVSSPSGGEISREILDRARALAEALNRDPAVQRLRQARRAVQEREAARIMLRDLLTRQQALLRREASGEAVSEQEWEEFRRVAEVVAYNPYVRELLQAEQAVTRLLAAVVAVLEEGLELPRMEEVEENGVAEPAPAPTAPAGPPPGLSRPVVATSGDMGPASSQGEGSPRVSVARSRLWVPGQPFPRQR